MNPNACPKQTYTAAVPATPPGPSKCDVLVQ